MEFLVITHFRDSFVASAPESVMRQIWEAEHEMINRQMEAGKIVKAYEITGWQRRAIIFKCDTSEELQQIMTEVPAYGKACYHEVYALSDYNETYKNTLKNIELGDDIMPGGMVK